MLKQTDGNFNFVDGRPTITSGRQDNRGFEGLAISPDETKLFAVLQDPLTNEGTSGTTNDGRYSRNVRIVRYDLATGRSDAQYIYQLESLSDINDRIPGTTNDSGATAQGRNISISALVGLNNSELLVLSDLSYTDLVIVQNGNNTLISADGDRLASLIRVQASSLTSNSFV